MTSNLNKIKKERGEYPTYHFETAFFNRVISNIIQC
jgi:hypothetical protein